MTPRERAEALADRYDATCRGPAPFRQWLTNQIVIEFLAAERAAFERGWNDCKERAAKICDGWFPAGVTEVAPRIRALASSGDGKGAAEK